jgi:hypothetical protein
MCVLDWTEMMIRRRKRPQTSALHDTPASTVVFLISVISGLDVFVISPGESGWWLLTSRGSDPHDSS